MATVFVTMACPRDASHVTAIYYQSDTGQMGLQLDETLLDKLLDGAWILDRREMFFDAPKATPAERVAILRKNMTPVSVAICSPDLEVQSLCEDQRTYRVNERIEEFRSRIRGSSGSSPAPPWLDLLADPEAHPEAVDRVVEHAKGLHAYGFGDRGCYARMYHRPSVCGDILVWLEEVCRRPGCAMQVVESSARVPTCSRR